MSGIHIVKQGEHLSGIAGAYGFTDYRTIWNYPDNAALQAQRQNPNVLFPGDQVVIPDKRPKELPKPTDQRHQFTKSGKPLKLQIKLAQSFHGPIANTPCDLFIGANQYPVTSDATGLIQQTIPTTAIQARLVIKQTIRVKGQQVPWQTELSIKIGYLDPVDQVSGQIGRLANMKYYRKPVDTVDQTELESAIEEFQCDFGVKPVDGICGPVTQAKLKQIYGC
jgi:hypothetical protein